MTIAQRRMIEIAIGIAIGAVIEGVLFGHGPGETFDRAYFMLAGAAVALFVK